LVDLSFTNFSGTIPDGISAGTVFDVSFTKIAGCIPDSLANKFTTLRAKHAKLEGTIPSASASFAFDELDLSGTNVSGTIPWSSWDSFRRLDLSRSKVSGTIPASLAKIDFEVLDLSWTDVSGTIPEALCERCNYNSTDPGGGPTPGWVSPCKFQVSRCMLVFFEFNGVSCICYI
jgi:hypothetical protein